jgi:hypothetical protein
MGLGAECREERDGSRHAAHQPERETARREWLDARTTRHAGCAISQVCWPPRIERILGWLKPIAGLRKVKLRALPKVAGLFTLACAGLRREAASAVAAGADVMSRPVSVEPA